MKILFFLSLLSLSLTLISQDEMPSGFDHNHPKFQKILNEVVKISNKQSLVNYKKVDLKALEEYLSELAQVSQDGFNLWNKKEKLAFLINLYNAATIKLIVTEKPEKSIKDLGGWFTSPWKKEFVKLFEKKVHLDFIEHDFIRKEFKENRIHFAVNCASLGCPSLANTVFTPSKLEEQLEAVKTHFLNNSTKNKVDHQKKTIFISKIFDWYKEDFAKDKAELITYFQKNMDEKIRPEYDIEYLDYNWNLNNSATTLEQ